MLPSRIEKIHRYRSILRLKEEEREREREKTREEFARIRARFFREISAISVPTGGM